MKRRRLSVKLSLYIACVLIPALGFTAWMVVQREAEIVTNLVIQRAQASAISGAAACSAILNAGVDSGAFTVEKLITPIYTKVQFTDDATKEPIEVEHQRYTTDFDAYTDTHGIREIQDGILMSSKDLRYSSMAVNGGYVPTAHEKYRHKPRGWKVGMSPEQIALNKKLDLEDSREKRKYDQPVILAAASFQGDNGEATLIQNYRRDKIEDIWDVAAPIRVKGKHFGAFRVGIAKDQVTARRREVALGIALWFGVLALGVVGFVFWLSRRTIRPLRQLAKDVHDMCTSEDDEALYKKMAPQGDSSDTEEIVLVFDSCETMRKALLQAKRLFEAAIRETNKSADVKSLGTTVVG